MKITIYFTLALATCLATPSKAFAQGRTVARLFWQDNSDASVRYGDLKKSDDGWSIQPNAIEGFPSIDTAEQSLVQMETDAGLILVGIHDHADGTVGSGWAAIESGAVEESHGDHSHWRFKETPRVIQSVVDADQGNPAHVYRYGKTFALANDKKNGFTITSAANLRSAKSPALAASFHDGGNGHITLAVVDDRVAYATWIARDGDDCGRVDVVGLGENLGKQYSIHCPTGGLHGATTNSGKVFLAPSDGVCWVDADRELDEVPETVQVNHLSLGNDKNDNPLRTGAFTNLDQLVVFTSGKGDDAKLCWINAASDAPSIRSLPIELAEGESLTTPVGVKARGGKQLAVMFRENKESPESDSLLVVDLDPNGDGDHADAAISTTVDIGRSQIEGHSGHHEAVVLPYGREIAITNPADGTISIFSVSDQTIVATIEVAGTPTRLVAIGG